MIFWPGFRKETGKPHKYLGKKHFRQKEEQIQKWEPAWEAQRTASERLNALTVVDCMRVWVSQSESRKDKVQGAADVVGPSGHIRTLKLLCYVRAGLDSVSITGGFSEKKWCVFTNDFKESCYHYTDKRLEGYSGSQESTSKAISVTAFFYMLLINKGFPGGTGKWYGIHMPVQETQETQVWSLGQEDPLESEMATHSSILAWRIPWTEEPGGLQSVESPRWLSMQACTHTYK